MRSSVCREQDFHSGWFQEWRKILLEAAPELKDDDSKVWGKVWLSMSGKFLHRKLWEWCAIAEALKERGMLSSDKQGLGFAVGTEPLPSLFASMGCSVSATDYPEASEGQNWQATGQLSTCLTEVHWPKLIDEETFRERVTFQQVDMRKTEIIPPQSQDFIWSSCAFEHLGSLDDGMEFVIKSLESLKPGGVAVHTTEFNITSNDATIEFGDSVIYRQRDIEWLDRRLRFHGAALESLDFEAGAGAGDIDYDFPPYYSHGRQHIKLLLHGHVSTSILLIIRKAAYPEER